MNKLLPILLVVVLSGCGGEVKSPLEKCADNHTLALWSDVKFMKSINFHNDCVKDKYHRQCNQQFIKDNFLTKPLSKKIIDRRYERGFKICEANRSRFPKTFDAKWQ